MARFLLLQLRPETEASDNEYQAILDKSGLDEARVHRIRLDCEALPEGTNPGDYAGVIVGGGPGCVSDAPETKDPVEARIEAACLAMMPQITEQDIPFMGCCYGIGILAHHLGAPVSKERYGESVGPVACTIETGAQADPMLQGLPKEFHALVGHKEAVQVLPDGAIHLISSDPCPFQMIRYGENVYATQFHPEADASVFETRVRVYLDRDYFPRHMANEIIERCRSQDISAPTRILANFAQRYG